MSDNQMVLGIDGDLHVVADDAGAATARRHRTAVGIGQRDLLVRRSAHLLLVDIKLAHFLPTSGPRQDTSMRTRTRRGGEYRLYESAIGRAAIPALLAVTETTLAMSGWRRQGN